jgi:hypothetical protein
VADINTEANNSSSDAVISADGRFVSFLSYADNLVANDDNFSSDVFVRDLGITYASLAISVQAGVTLSPGTRAPVVDLNGPASNFANSTTFVEDSPAVSITTADATITDADSTALASLTLRLLATPDGNAELLATDTAGTPITANYSPSTRTLTLTGPASISDFQTVLRRTTYRDLTDAPTVTPARLVQVVASDGLNLSSPRQATIAIVAVNDAPQVGPSTGTVTYVIGSAATTIDSALTVVDADSMYWYANNTPGYALGLTRATVQITGGFIASQDRLVYTPTQGIAGSYNATTGLLTLSGVASIERYQAALRNVRYVNTSSVPNTLPRTITIQGFDGSLWSTPATRTVQFASMLKGEVSLAPVKREPSPLEDRAWSQIVATAVARWQQSGIIDSQLAVMNQVRFVVRDLDAQRAFGLAIATNHEIVLDDNALGHGWFVDPSPQDDRDFGRVVAPTERQAEPGTSAAGRVDLLTVVMHELGHLAGLDDLPHAIEPHAVMAESLDPGVRRMPSAGAWSDAVDHVWGESFAYLTTISDSTSKPPLPRDRYRLDDRHWVRI